MVARRAVPAGPILPCLTHAPTQVSLIELRGKPAEDRLYRLTYRSNQDFARLARSLGIMEDLKSGVPRTGYLGVVSFYWQGNKIHLAPPPDWRGYTES